MMLLQSTQRKEVRGGIKNISDFKTQDIIICFLIPDNTVMIQYSSDFKSISDFDIRCFANMFSLSRSGFSVNLSRPHTGFQGQSH